METQSDPMCPLMALWLVLDVRRQNGTPDISLLSALITMYGHFLCTACKTVLQFMLIIISYNGAAY